MTDFTGFPKQTLTFLRGLRRNNSKTWFDEHRADYDHYWVEPAKSFVGAAGDALRKVAPVEADPRVNGSIFRINRDVRFSKDKRPYKDHLDFWFWEGERRTAPSGFFFRVSPDGVGIGVGAHGFDRDRLADYRAAVVDRKSGPALGRAVTVVGKAGYDVKGEHYKQTPRGFEPRSERQELMLRYSSLWIGEDHPLSPRLHSPEVVDWAVGEWKQMKPIHRWLVDHLG
jgi:uncharacterized protein (TIGR02453 family)